MVEEELEAAGERVDVEPAEVAAPQAVAAVAAVGVEAVAVAVGQATKEVLPAPAEANPGMREVSV